MLLLYITANFSKLCTLKLPIFKGIWYSSGLPNCLNLCGKRKSIFRCDSLKTTQFSYSLLAVVMISAHVTVHVACKSESCSWVMSYHLGSFTLSTLLSMLFVWGKREGNSVCTSIGFGRWYGCTNDLPGLCIMVARFVEINFQHYWLFYSPSMIADYILTVISKFLSTHSWLH